MQVHTLPQQPVPGRFRQAGGPCGPSTESKAALPFIRRGLLEISIILPGHALDVQHTRLPFHKGPGAREGHQRGQALHPTVAVDGVEGWPIGSHHSRQLVMPIQDAVHVAMWGTPHHRRHSLELAGCQPVTPPVAEAVCIGPELSGIQQHWHAQLVTNLQWCCWCQSSAAWGHSPAGRPGAWLLEAVAACSTR